MAARQTRVAVYTQVRGNWGGSCQYAVAFVRALAGLEHSSYELRLWYEYPDPWEDVCRRLGITGYACNVYDIPDLLQTKLSPLLQLMAQNKLPSEQAAELTSALHKYSNRATMPDYAPHIIVLPQMGGTCPIAVPNAKYVTVCHDLMHLYEKGFPEACAADEITARDKAFNAVIAQCDRILVDSKVGASQVLEKYPGVRDGQLRVLPYTAFGDVLTCVPARPQGNFPEKFFFYPAQFWKHKNHVALAKAMAGLKSTLPDIHLVAAGNIQHNGYADFQEVVTVNGLESHFTLPGHIAEEELAWCYRHARALIMPTFFGPTNIPPLEAMALGCPVAVSGIYAMPERYGDAALYFNPANSDDLASAMQKLWVDDALCDSLRTKGLARAGNWTFENFCEGVRNIVRELA